MAKRVIGVGGDKVEFFDGYVILNGSLLDESAYISDEIETNSGKFFDIPEGSVFVLGDNREDSTDSRFWKTSYIQKEKILGKYIFGYGFNLNYLIRHKNDPENKIETENEKSLNDPLDVGETGYTQIVDEYEAELKPSLVYMVEKLDQSVLNDTVKEYYDNSIFPEDYDPLPDGCHWEGVYYGINLSEINPNNTADPFIYIKLLDTAGKNLKSHGKTYTSRTHDLDLEYKEGDWLFYFTFYAVPDDRDEYVLRFGADNDRYTYFKLDSDLKKGKDRL